MELGGSHICLILNQMPGQGTAREFMSANPTKGLQVGQACEGSENRSSKECVKTARVISYFENCLKEIKHSYIYLYFCLSTTRVA